MDLAKRRRERLQGLDVAPMPALATVAPVSVGTAYVPQARADTAVDELGVPAPGHALVCLTAGQWSLIDLVRATIERTGPARLRLSTWTTGVRDAENAAWLLSTGALTGLQVFTDASFPVREPEYCHRLDTPRDEVGAAFQRMAGSAPEVKAAPETAAGRLARLRASRGARK